MNKPKQDRELKKAVDTYSTQAFDVPADLVDDQAVNFYSEGSVKALLQAARKEADKYWQTYYGMASADQETPFSKLSDYQRKVLTDYHTRQLSKLKSEEQNNEQAR